MDGYEIIDTAHGEFEAFYTSGGASHTIQSMQRRGVQNCDYKTLRYPGHIDIIRFLLDKCEYSDDQMAKIFEKGCGIAEKDVVIILAEVHKEDIVWKKELKITTDFQFSAMQRATAFPISAVARMMAEGIFDNRIVQNRGGDIKLPLQLTYRDIPFDKFKKYLNELNLDT
jgi:saccharopine dehydrogenase-like NADP-dependent oxidoreductase